MSTAFFRKKLFRQNELRCQTWGSIRNFCAPLKGNFPQIGGKLILCGQMRAGVKGTFLRQDAQKKKTNPLVPPASGGAPFKGT